MIRLLDFAPQVIASCPTAATGIASREFQSLWSDLVDRPWMGGAENVLGVFGLNLEVFQNASGREGDRYKILAQANMARCKARWLEIPSDSEWTALETEEPGEVPWLELLINRNNPEHAAKIIASWKPREYPWDKIKMQFSAVYSLDRKKSVDLPPCPSSPIRPYHEAQAAAYDVAVERAGLRLSERGQWKRILTQLARAEGLYMTCFRLGASLYDPKLKKQERRASELLLRDSVYYLERLRQRFGIRGWDRAMALQSDIIQTVLEKCEKIGAAR